MASSHRPEFLAGARPRVFAHRGLAIDAPENTLLAFLKALNAGATHLETDVQATLDGVAVISHDADLSRVAGRDIQVNQLTVAELRRIDLGHGQCFVSLDELLEAFPDARLNIDVKSDDAVGPTAAAIIRHRATDRVLITSFSENRRRRTAALLPGVASSASSSGVVRAVFAAKLGLTRSTRRAVRGLRAVQIPERSNGVRLVTPRVISALHAAGVEVHVWTVNDPRHMSRLLDMGIDGIVTDRTDLAVALIASRV